MARFGLSPEAREKVLAIVAADQETTLDVSPETQVFVQVLNGSGAPSVPRECACGCGEMTKGGLFIPGHDAKMKGALYHVIKGTPDKSAQTQIQGKPIGEWTSAQAQATLVEFGWPPPVVKEPKPKADKPAKAPAKSTAKESTAKKSTAKKSTAPANA